MVNKYLEKVSWKTRRISFKFVLGYVTYDTGMLEINLLRIDTDRFITYSLFKFECRLPNKTTVKRFTVDNWDLLFLKTPLRSYYLYLVDKELWNRYYLTRWEKFVLSILSRIL